MYEAILFRPFAFFLHRPAPPSELISRSIMHQRSDSFSPPPLLLCRYAPDSRLERRLSNNGRRGGGGGKVNYGTAVLPPSGDNVDAAQRIYVNIKRRQEILLLLINCINRWSAEKTGKKTTTKRDWYNKMNSSITSWALSGSRCTASKSYLPPKNGG